MRPGFGTINNLMGLATMGSYALISPGHNIYLRGGTYSGDFICNLVGTAASPIIIQPYPGEHPVIDGSLTIRGGYTHWTGIEIRYSGWSNRQTAQAGSSPTDIPTTKLLEIQGAGCKVINCVIHDLATVGIRTAAEIYGSLIYGIGWSGPDRGHGHSLYAQNATAGRQIIKHNTMLDSFGLGIHAYAEGGALQNYDIEENIIFKSGSLYSAAYNNILMGGLVTPDDPHIIGNNLYDGGMAIGYSGNGATHVTCQDNYSPGGIAESGTVQYDVNTGNYTSAPIGDRVSVFLNDYQSDRANISIYNQSNANTIAVDLSTVTGLSVGDSVNVHNAQDYFSDIQVLTLDDNKKITVNMQAANRTVAAPYEWTAPPTAFPSFGSFVIEKV